MEKISNEKLKSAMIENCVGVLELSRRAKIQASVISRLLKGDSSIRLPTLGKISKALSVSANDLLLKE